VRRDKFWIRILFVIMLSDARYFGVFVFVGVQEDGDRTWC
jgi:hypothetical protein